MTKQARIYNTEKTIFSRSVAGKTVQVLANNEIRTLLNTIHTHTHTHTLKMD